MAVFAAPMTAKAYAPVVSASSSVRNVLNLAIQPPSGGMPVSEARRVLDEPAERRDLGAARRAGDGDDHGEGAEVGEGVHQQVHDDRLEGRLTGVARVD